jgi:hypothetical protein
MKSILIVARPSGDAGHLGRSQPCDRCAAAYRVFGHEAPRVSHHSRGERQTREAELLEPGKAKPLRFSWDKQISFLANQQIIDATILSSRARVEVVYRQLFFENPH